jgi:hypothetical protein
MEFVKAKIERIAQGSCLGKGIDADEYVVLRVTTALGVTDLEVDKAEFLRCVLGLFDSSIQVEEKTTYTIIKKNNEIK